MPIRRHQSDEWNRYRLFFEEILEGLASVGWTAGNGIRESSSNLRRLLIGSRSGVLFNGGAKFVKLAIVFAVFGSDALRNILRALKLGAGIKETTLFAAVKFGIALGAGAAGIETGSKHGSAIGAAGAGDGADHARSARSEMIILSAGAALRGLAFGARFLFFVAIAISAMAVLTIHKFLRTLLPTNQLAQNVRCWQN
jgi:hypothetical protein